MNNEHITSIIFDIFKNTNILDLKRKDFHENKFDLVLYNEYLISFFKIYENENELINNDNWLYYQEVILNLKKEEIDFFGNKDLYLIILLKFIDTSDRIDFVKITSNQSVCRKQILFINDSNLSEEIKKISFYPIETEYEKSNFRNLIINKIIENGYSENLMTDLIEFKPGREQIIENFFNKKYFIKGLKNENK